MGNIEWCLDYFTKLAVDCSHPDLEKIEEDSQDAESIELEHLKQINDSSSPTATPIEEEKTRDSTRKQKRKLGPQGCSTHSFAEIAENEVTSVLLSSKSSDGARRSYTLKEKRL